MPSEGLARSETPLRLPGRAKSYNRTKLIAGISSSVVSFLLLVALVWMGPTRQLAGWAWAIGSYHYIALLVFTAMVGLLQSLVTLPIGFYSGYIIEHRYGLSNQSLGRWAWERMKGSLVGLPLVAAVLMPLSNQFWGDRYGQVKDPFGHVWTIGTHIEDVSLEEMQRRAAALPSM